MIDLVTFIKKWLQQINEFPLISGIQFITNKGYFDSLCVNYF